jgi:hypothetical protein
MRAIDLFEEAIARRLAAELDRLNVTLPPVRPLSWWFRPYVVQGTGRYGRESIGQAAGIESDSSRTRI